MITRGSTLSRTTMTKLKSYGCGLVISAVTLILCLGGVELTGYIWEQQTAQSSLGWTLVGARRLHLERHGSVSQPYYLLAPNEDVVWRGIPVHMNSHGFRTQEFKLPKPPGTFRILNLGDSIAFGWEVKQEDTYGKQLERMLNTRGSSPRYEVINAGVPGWNPQDEHNFLLQEGLSYQPDVVILDITVVNDIYGGELPKTESNPVFQWLRDNTYSWPFLTIQARFLLSRQQGPEAIPVLNPPKNADAYYPLDENDPTYGEMWDIIAEMVAACKARNVQFIILPFPTALQVNSAAHPNVPQRILGQRARAAGIPFIDLLPVYQKWCLDNGLEACEGYQNRLFADVWMHPTEIGHRLAADQLMGVFTEGH